MRKFYLLIMMGLVWCHASAQSQVVTTGNNVIDPTNPYVADIVIGSEVGTRHDASIMWWSSGSASRISNTNDVFYLSVWNTINPNIALAATVGAPSYFLGNIGIGTKTPIGKLEINDGNGTGPIAYFGANGITNGKGLYFSRPVSNTNPVNIQGTLSGIGATNISMQAEGGNVGIGTSNPGGVLQITNNVPYADNPANQLVLSNGGYRNSESGGLPADNAGLAYYFTNYNAGGKQYDRTLDIKVRGAADGTFGAGMIRFFANSYTAGSAEREIMRIHGNGNVLIGKTSQVNPAYMLDVAGNIRSNQVVVNTTGADFVFAPNYRLNSLSMLKRYIDQNHHLPEVPSAKEMQKNGLNLGDNEVKLLQKVEELTLYLIEKDDQIKKLEKRLETLEKRKTKKK